ncbi:VOC family protein [Nocardia sp. NPDC052254]|uniref:VOC family protein n=1 Tax=Nocardia sp. NPDC052254 TaxID=3155681 RepID=UPI003447827A
MTDNRAAGSSVRSGVPQGTGSDSSAPVTEIPADPLQARDPGNPPVPSGALLLELVPLPVTDLDRSIEFYRDRAGFHLDVDVTPAPDVRIVQLTPPGSACSILLSAGLPTTGAPAGTVRGLHLVVADIAAARNVLLDRGIEVGDIEDVGGGVLYAYFADPDGNTWCLQYMPWR